VHRSKLYFFALV